ncbi:hypothetical protein CAEBREN_14358 [Caenorhabditis brenneri]|uniref:Uncharacterized protein n=1 Tax=Caenorhabditis brenneri TaxID=135651 RepID=G0MA16_CAEBE|nr:hypothetical protein CAEBREN_14358 [Caenorhabditis brenneri]
MEDPDWIRFQAACQSWSAVFGIPSIHEKLTQLISINSDDTRNSHAYNSEKVSFAKLSFLTGFYGEMKKIDDEIRICKAQLDNCEKFSYFLTVMCTELTMSISSIIGYGASGYEATDDLYKALYTGGFVATLVCLILVIFLKCCYQKHNYKQNLKFNLNVDGIVGIKNGAGTDEEIWNRYYSNAMDDWTATNYVCPISNMINYV